MRYGSDVDPEGRLLAPFFLCELRITYMNTFFEPNWNRSWLFVEFDPWGNACALQDRYARKAQEADSAWLCELEDQYGPDSAEVKEYEDQHPWWGYLDSVRLGPYMWEQPEDGPVSFPGS